MKILIVKLGALGDVLRTTPLLTRIKKTHPSSLVTWVVDEKCADVLEGNMLIDELLTYSPKTLAELGDRYFDWAVNLDKEPEALDTLDAAKAGKKMGFGRLSDGKMGALDSHSDYAYRLGIDDNLKFKNNQKTYQQITFEQLGFDFGGEEYIFSIPGEDKAYIKDHLRSLGYDAEKNNAPVIGLNTGSGHRFAGKKLPEKTFVKLAEQFHKELGATIFLLGGRDEIERNCEIERMTSCPVINTGSHSIRRFASIVQHCDLLISGDTTAMHIAVAVKTPVVVYFASTCAAEIELYGRGEKIISDLPCAPCYLGSCPIDEKCMKEMSAEKIAAAVKKTLLKKVAA